MRGLTRAMAAFGWCGRGPSTQRPGISAAPHGGRSIEHREELVERWASLAYALFLRAGDAAQRPFSREVRDGHGRAVPAHHREAALERAPRRFPSLGEAEG